MPSQLQTLLLLQSLAASSALPGRARLNASGGSGGTTYTARTKVRIKSPGIIAGIALVSVALVMVILAVFIWRRKVWQDQQDREDLERAERRTLDDAGSPMVVGRDGSVEEELGFRGKGGD